MLGPVDGAGASGKTRRGDMGSEWILELLPVMLGVPALVVLAVVNSAINVF
jgi:hypothetical protein